MIYFGLNSEMAQSFDTACDSPQPVQFERAIPFRESKGPLGPFRATKIWNDLVEHLKNKVELKRRRHKIRYFDLCFTGSDAVDVVLHFLLNDRETFSTDLSREKAVKVCQMLMNKKVFKSAVDKPETVQPFEDSSSKLFQFLSQHAPVATIVEEETNDNAKDDEVVRRSDATPKSDTLRLSDHRYVPEEEPFEGPEDIQNGRAHRPLRDIHLNGMKSYESRDRTSTKLSCHIVGDKPTISPVPSEVVEETWKEVALSQLLTIVELTFLDGILSEDKDTQNQQQRQNLIITNIVAKNWNLPIMPSDITTPADPLLQTAMDCIEFLPKGLNLLSEPILKRRGLESKLWAKDIIIKHYTGLSECLLPRRFLELNLAILNLILQGSIETALSALQMYMILLPVTTREELYRLLNFMHSLVFDSALMLDPHDSNEMVVLSTFTDCIFKHKLLASNLAQKLVQTMVMNVECIFSTPRGVREKVSKKLHSIKTGRPVLGADSTYCDRVTIEEYERQSKDSTEQSLVDLMNKVLDDTTISLKEKKQRLKQFHKAYPELYEKNFNGLI